MSSLNNKKSELLSDASTSTGHKMSFRDILLCQPHQKVDDLSDLPDLIDEDDNVVHSSETEVSDKEKPIKAKKIRRRRKKKSPPRKGPFEVKEFVFSPEELEQKNEYEARLRVRRIFIEEIESDEEEDSPVTVVLAKKKKLADKNRRKRMNRIAAKAAAATAVACFERLISHFIEEQAPKIRHSPIVAQNIAAMEAMKFTKAGIEDTLRGYNCAAALLSQKKLRRIKREFIQRLSAVSKIAEAARKEVDRAKKRTIARDLLRQIKEESVEEQSPLLVSAAVSATVGVALSSLVSAVRSIGRVEEKATTFFDTITDQIKKLASGLKKYGTALKCIVVYTVGSYLICMTDNFALKMLLTLTCCTCAPEVGKTVQKTVAEFFQKAAVVEEQDGFEFGLIPKVVSIVTLYFLGVHGKSNILSAAAEAVGRLPRLHKGAETLMEFIMSAIEAVINVVLKLLRRPEFHFRQKYTKEVEAVIKKAWELDRRITSKAFVAKDSPGTYSECMGVLSDVIRLIGAIHHDKELRMELCQVRNIISSHTATLRIALGHTAGFRVEPVSVVIESDPGVGKTMNINALVCTVLKNSGIMSDLNKDNVHRAMFTRPPNSDYFDGYYGQECYYLDDMFAVKPIPGKVSHFEDVMAFYGTVTTPLNMADCDKKGMFPFTSSLLLMTTNVKNLDEVGAGAILVKPAAFKRRFDIHVHMEVKPQYAMANDSTKLNYDLYTKECKRLRDEGKFGIDAHPWYMWEVWDTTFDQATTFIRGTGKCFSTVVKRIIDALKYKRMSHHNDMDHLALLMADKPLTDDESAASSKAETTWSSFEAEEQSDVFFTDVAHEEHVARYAVYSDEDDDEDEIADDWSICEYDNRNFRKFRESIRSYTDPPLMRTNSEDVEEKGKPTTDKNVIRRNASVDPPTLRIRINYLWDSLSKVDMLIVGFAIFGCVTAFKALCKRSDGEVAEEESNGPQAVANGYKQPAAVAQSLGINTLHDKVYKQSYKMVVALGDGETTALGQIIFVAGNIAVMPNHFLIQLLRAVDSGVANDATRVHLLPGIDSGTKIKTTIGAILSYPRTQDDDNDVAFVNFNRGLRRYADISKHFLTEKEIKTIGGRKVAIHVAERVDEQGQDACRRLAIHSEAFVGKAPLQTNTRSYPRWIRYNATTMKGYCGAPVMITDSRYFSCRVVAGLHVAGAPAYDTGYATFLSAEMVAAALKHFKYVDVPEATHEESLWPESIVVQSIDEVDFTVDGTLGTAVPLYRTSDGPSAPVRSKMVKTGFGEEKFFDEEIALMNEGREPPELVPMKLGRHTGEDGETVFPMMEAVKPFVGDVFLPANNSFSKGLAAGLKPFAKATANYDAKTLSFEEAVVGSNVMGLKSLTRSTSVGFPLCMKASDKKYFFGSDEDFNLTTKEALELQSEVFELEQLLRSGKRPQFVCRDFLKDETRKLGKSARLIAGTDIRYYILCRMFFGAFVGSVCRSHQESGMCLGMNPYSEWDVLKRLLINPDPTGKNVWDGDFGQFDSSQMPRLLWDCLEYINNWYAVRGCGEDNPIREALFWDLVSSRHLMSLTGKATTVVEWSKSLPSGHFLTSTINSMLSMGLVAASYIGLTGRLDFWDTSAAVSLGDDNVVSTSDALVEVFNQVTVSRYLRDTFDMVYTAGRKGEELRPVIGIDDVVFLQRRFAMKNGRVVCPIRPESFLHSLYYVKTLDHTRNVETLKAGIELAFEELAMHDEKYWGVVAPKLVEAKALLGDVPEQVTTSSDAYFDLVQGRVPSYI